MFMHGPDTHSFVSSPQLNPLNPALQAQAYLPASTGFPRSIDVESVHSDKLVHGSDVHSFTSVAQLTPAYPSVHLHVYPFTFAVHTAALLHGDDAHSSTSVSQL